MGSKKEHSRVDAQGGTDEAVDSGIAVVRAEQGQHAAVEALADLGQVEAKARGLGVYGSSNDRCSCGQTGCQPANMSAKLCQCCTSHVVLCKRRVRWDSIPRESPL